MRETLSERIDAARRELERLRPGGWEARALAETTEGRAVVEFVAGGERLVGKLFAVRDDHRHHDRFARALRVETDGERAFHQLERLASWNLPTLRVPRPVLWCAAPRVLISERARGRPCATMALHEWPDVMPRIGRALRELHGQRLWPEAPSKGLEQVYEGKLRVDVRDHVHDLMRPAPELLGKAFPEHAKTIERTLARIYSAQEGWGDLPPTHLHRDFQLRQLFDDGRHVTVLDWDDMRYGDPAFDVGYFSAYLKTHHAAQDAEAGVAAFRSGYGGDEGIWARVPVYERFNFLRRACRRYRLQESGWRDELAAMMARLDAD